MLLPLLRLLPPLTLMCHLFTGRASSIICSVKLNYTAFYNNHLCWYNNNYNTIDITTTQCDSWRFRIFSLVGIVYKSSFRWCYKHGSWVSITYIKVNSRTPCAVWIIQGWVLVCVWGGGGKLAKWRHIITSLKCLDSVLFKLHKRILFYRKYIHSNMHEVPMERT